MSDALMIEVQEWLSKLCVDAERRGLRPVDMFYLLASLAIDYTVRLRAQDAEYQILREVSK